jgi:hypothetical protein
VPPADPSITTLWLGNVEADVTETDLREVMYPYGFIQGMHIVRSAKVRTIDIISSISTLLQCLIVCFPPNLSFLPLLSQ